MICVLYAASLGGTASVVGDRGYILDESNLEILALQSTDSCLTACAGALYEYFNSLETVLLGSSCSCLGSGLSSERSRLLGASETETACGSPRDSVALHICNSNDSVVEGGLDMNLSLLDILSLTTATDSRLLLRLSHSSYPPYFFLLAMVFTGPLRVLAFVLVLCPLTGRPLL